MLDTRWQDGAAGLMGWAIKITIKIKIKIGEGGRTLPCPLGPLLYGLASAS